MTRSAQVMAALLVGFALASCGGSSTPAEKAKGSATFVVDGDMSVPLDQTYHGVRGATIGGKCKPAQGYDDITAGAQVIVSTDTGKTLALGRLAAPKVVSGVNSTKIRDAFCRASFIVTGVPDGRQFYKVTIGRRGAQQYTRTELRDPIHLDLK